MGLPHGGHGAQRLLFAAQLAASARGILLGSAQRAGYIRCSNPQRIHLHRIDVHTDLTLYTAQALHPAHARHVDQHLAQRVVHEPGQGDLVHGLRTDRVGQDRAAADRLGADGGLQQLRRQIRAHAVDRVLGLYQRIGQRLFQRELGLDLHLAIGDRGAGVAQAGDAGQRVLDLACDLGFELCRRGAGLGQRHVDRGQVHVRQGLYRQLPEAIQACQRQQHEQQDGRNRVAQ